MTPLVEPLPNVAVSPDLVSSAVYHRHLGFPPGAALDEHMLSLANQARTWYESHGEPWHAASLIDIRSIDDEVVFLDHGITLQSSQLAEGLARADAQTLVVVAATAGASVDHRIDELWQCERPDEAMFLNAYAIAVVEQLRARAADHLRDLFAPRGLTVLPHYSPGYDGWDLSDHKQLFAILTGPVTVGRLPIELLESGGLQPAKSIIAVYGITSRTDLSNARRDYWTRSARSAESTSGTQRKYAFSEKTLKLWRDKRLRLSVGRQREISACFRFDGSTCNSMGVPIAVNYNVSLERDGNGFYRIAASSCQPAEGDVGFSASCAYIEDPIAHSRQIGNYQPLLGALLCEVLDWNPPTSPAGCLCSQASQDHKWRIVLQTIHFALESHE